jgi:hypothetical protein
MVQIHTVKVDMVLVVVLLKMVMMLALVALAVEFFIVDLEALQLLQRLLFSQKGF